MLPLLRWQRAVGALTSISWRYWRLASAENRSGDVVAGPYRGSEVLQWQVLLEAGDADDPAGR